ncbi:MAG TPA: hypothetical protein VKU82_14160, partial [Planctomycetaceae bacterium]|nr:hypothetical protein [Planctomycetaceae bacterium]
WKSLQDGNPEVTGPLSAGFADPPCNLIFQLGDTPVKFHPGTNIRGCAEPALERESDPAFAGEFQSQFELLPYSN